MSRSTPNTNEANRNVVRNIKLGTINEIRKIIDPHLHDSGFVKGVRPKGATEAEVLRICVFDHDDNDEPVSFENEDLRLTIEGYTEEGVITDSWIGIATIDYEDLMFEQAS